MEPDTESLKKLLHERIENDFLYHSLNNDQIANMQDIRWHAKNLAHVMANHCQQLLLIWKLL